MYRVAVVHGANPRESHTRERALAAARLYKSKGVYKLIIITTGRWGEAEGLAKTVLNAGVPSKDICTEPDSRTTYENLLNAKYIIDNELSKKLGDPPELIYLISQNWHEERVSYLASKVLKKNYSYKFYPACDPRTQVDISRAIHCERKYLALEKLLLWCPVMGPRFYLLITGIFRR